MTLGFTSLFEMLLHSPLVKSLILLQAASPEFEYVTPSHPQTGSQTASYIHPNIRFASH